MYPMGHEIHGGFMTGIPGDHPCNYLKKSQRLIAFKWQSPTSWPTYRVLSLAKSRIHGDDWATFPAMLFGWQYIGRIYQRLNLPLITVSTRHDFIEWCMSHIYNTSEGTFQSDLSRVSFIHFFLKHTHTQFELVWLWQSKKEWETHRCCRNSTIGTCNA